MSKNQEYALQYADYAMAQMRRYGIPASVTLAQGMPGKQQRTEPSGEERENNHFGIAATPPRVGLPEAKYGIYTDR